MQARRDVLGITASALVAGLVGEGSDDYEAMAMADLDEQLAQMRGFFREHDLNPGYLLSSYERARDWIRSEAKRREGRMP